MDVILMQDVHNLGAIGDLVKVRDGYARNFLLPKGMAVLASTKNQRRLEHEKKVAGFRLKQARIADEAMIGQLKGKAVTIARKVGEQDKLYGSVTPMDIETALSAEGVNVDRRKIELVEPIKQLGVYEIPVRLRKDLVTEIQVSVVAE